MISPLREPDRGPATAAAALVAGEAITVASDAVALRHADPGRELEAVRLHTDLLKRSAPPEFERSGDEWVLRLARPRGVARMEYVLEVVGRDGSVIDPDPANPHRTRGPFGERSVIEFADYRAPAWLGDEEAPRGSLRPVRLESRRLRAAVRGLVWSPPEADPAEPLPLLVVHDGPEYAEYAQLTRLLETATAELELPPMRAALLAPVAGARNEHYSASVTYSAALVHELLPALARVAPTSGERAHRAGMGASLGALAMLHAHRLHADSFAGLFLQSGSFFRQRFDAQERGFPRFARIARFVGTVLRAPSWPDAVPVSMTCGTGEENLENNRAMQDALAAQGYSADLDEHPDAHNWVAWRDTFDPHLISFLARLWS